MSKYIAFDAETTGLDVNVNNLLTACFIVLDSDLNELDRLNISLKSENYFINPKAIEVNKIDIVKHHLNSKDLINTKVEIINFLKKNKTNFYLIPIGHNVSFDILFIKKLLGLEYNNYFSYNSVDTIVIAQYLKICKKLPDRQSVSLISLCNYFGIKVDKETKFHNSEFDTEMTIQLLKQFVKID